MVAVITNILEQTRTQKRRPTDMQPPVITFVKEEAKPALPNKTRLRIKSPAVNPKMGTKGRPEEKAPVPRCRPPL